MEIKRGRNRRTGRLVHLVAWLFVIWAVASLPPAVHAQGPVIDIKTDVGIDQHVNEQVPLDLTFRDEHGQTVRLGAFIGNKPIILTLNYFRCPNLCPLSLDHLTQALADLKFNLGDEYEVVTASIDPRETPDMAAYEKWSYVRDYGRAGRGDGWHFVTGDQGNITALAQAVGFRYAYNSATDEFAHPLALVVLTPQGRIARYIYGVDYPSRDVELALIDAGQGRTGSIVDQLLSVCYHYDPAAGRYSVAILDAVRWAGVATIVGMAVWIFWLWKTDPKRTA